MRAEKERAESEREADYTVRVYLVLLSTGQAAKTIETITRQVREIDTGKERQREGRQLETETEPG